MAYILGIDVGTGSTKAVATDLSGNVLATAKRSYQVLQPQPGHSEQEPHLIFEAFCASITDVVQQLGESPQTISFSSAMHSVIPVNSSGQALANMMTWADTRADAIAENLRLSAEGEMIYRLSGTPIHAMSPLCKILWLKRNKPGLYHATYKFISIKEYIWYQLFSEYQIDYGMASATGIFDILKLQWSEAICEVSGIDINKLSQPVNTVHQRKDIDIGVAIKLGVTASTIFFIGSTDGCCANLGSLAMAPGTAALTIGTSGAVRVTGNKPIYNFASMTFNYLLTESIFVSGGAVNNGGIAVNWLLSNFMDKFGLASRDYNELFDKIGAVPAGSDGLIFLPYLYGDRAPIWAAKATGAYFNIKPVHSQAHFLRAALEGVCYALNDVLKSLEASVKIDQLNVSGGFIHSEVWMQMLADVTGKKLVMLQLEDASAVGAAYLAMQTLYPDADLPMPTDIEVVEPRKANAYIYQKTFPIFKQLYADTERVRKQLDQLNT